MVLFVVFFVLFDYPGFGAAEGPLPREETDSRELERKNWDIGKICGERDKAARPCFLSTLPLLFPFCLCPCLWILVSRDFMLLILASPVHLVVPLLNPFHLEIPGVRKIEGGEKNSLEGI